MSIHLHELDLPRFQNADHLIEEIGWHILANIVRLTNRAINAAEIATGCNLDERAFDQWACEEVKACKIAKFRRRGPGEEFYSTP